MTSQIELSAGTLDYEDTGGEGPVVVLLGGLMMDASLWEDVIADLSGEHRCVAPTLPMGAHSHAMSPDADLSPCGQARLVSELLERLDANGAPKSPTPAGHRDPGPPRPGVRRPPGRWRPRGGRARGQRRCRCGSGCRRTSARRLPPRPLH
jgi:pimeloyl-ACP methyl ester carboxylesterase